ncbi:MULTISPECIES: NADPH-dependent FMN reductase [Methylosinus]|uniref:NAD(P)H-dependent oxidoreductase n=1 Tax=Methylosinus trichosporium (strain ATCC 35070 / NCIMB 11131 / UNIQEM 75 / OB3b) TaxID=595536 RepID=A0A2D2D4E1_METT3|nr:MULTISPECIES: NADPH-dependent FMN reductase [Methylosinus]ATQ69880.1 NAD(P)H-dependent oxidoreductase [Methylosinus trichosporium OB3b]OBS53904.1 NADPH-dependent FMN reductase [Methylosinus sp. 3S-1]
MAETNRLSIVLINGSLRAKSINGAVVATAAALAPPGVNALVYRRLGELPHFNPDDDRDPLPETAAELRALLRGASAVLLSTPEYAGSLPGSFKNLLDWTVGGGSLYRLPVAWINPAARGRARDTYAALRIVLDRAGVDIVESACADIPVSQESVGDDGLIADDGIRSAIAGAMRALADAALRRENAAL